MLYAKSYRCGYTLYGGGRENCVMFRKKFQKVAGGWMLSLFDFHVFFAR